MVPLWPPAEQPRFARPWREVGYVLIAVLGVLLLGQLWSRGIRLPNTGTAGPLFESINQLIIFAPIMLVPIVRRHTLASAWIRIDRMPQRVVVGVGLSLVALLLFAVLKQGAPSWTSAVAGVYRPSKVHVAVQVLLEDLAIAILFVRLSAAAGPRAALLGVAGLFAAAHIPAMLTQGDLLSELTGLVRDFGLGVLVLATVSRSADVAWLWPVHYSLDMTQFLGG